MKSITKRALILAAASIGLMAAAPAPAPAPAPYTKEASIPLPKGTGWDYSAFDPYHDRLFVTHGDSVVMVNLAHNDKVSSFGSIHHGHAVVPIPGTSKVAVTSGHDQTVRIFDVPSGKQIASISTPPDPDGAIIDPVTHHLLVMNGDAGKVTEINLKQARVIREIALQPGLEFPAVVPGHILFVNNERRSEIETVNLNTGKPGPVIGLKTCQHPTGMAFDARHHRVISACANGVAEVVDTRTKSVVQTLPIGSGPDAVLIDKVRQLALIPCGRSGTLEVFSIAGPKVRKLASVKTEVGARTGALDESTGTVYLPTAKLIPGKPGHWPKMVPGTFHFVVMKRTPHKPA